MNTVNFIQDLKWNDLPLAVRNQARRCLLDTIGTAIGGRCTDLSAIVYEFAVTAFGGTGAQLWLDGRELSPPGAALAHGMTIDALDIHDGHLQTKGHAGVALIPAALATLSMDADGAVSGEELLTTVVLGYEIAVRAGMALHATACDYHTSGAWNALGCAAITARRLQLDHEQTRHALGIAEYHGPRSQMMRCIDHPTMLKDGSGWGAMTGISAAMLAGAGFTGAPALTVESGDVADVWADLGERWLILDQFFKPYAVCYWAQPAINGALQLQRAHNLPVSDIERIRVYAFHEATRLAHPHPENTEQAQYSLPFPVATALVHGELGWPQLSGRGLHDPRVLELAERVELIEDEKCNAGFPNEFYSRVEVETTGGEVLDSGAVKPHWDITAPPTDGALREKYRWVASLVLPQARVAEIEKAVWGCAELPVADQIVSLLALAAS